MRTTNYLDSVPELVMPETVTNYYTTMLIKFKTGVGSATFIVRLQDHLPGALMFEDALLHFRKYLHLMVGIPSRHDMDYFGIKSTSSACSRNYFAPKISSL